MSASPSPSSATDLAARRSRPAATPVTLGMLLAGVLAVAVAAGVVVFPELAGFEGPGFFVAAPVCVVVLGAIVGIVSNRLLRR